MVFTNSNRSQGGQNKSGNGNAQAKPKQNNGGQNGGGKRQQRSNNGKQATRAGGPKVTTQPTKVDIDNMTIGAVASLEKQLAVKKAKEIEEAKKLVSMESGKSEVELINSYITRNPSSLPIAKLHSVMRTRKDITKMIDTVLLNHTFEGSKVKTVATYLVTAEFDGFLYNTKYGVVITYNTRKFEPGPYTYPFNSETAVVSYKQATMSKKFADAPEDTFKYYFTANRKQVSGNTVVGNFPDFEVKDNSIAVDIKDAKGVDFQSSVGDALDGLDLLDEDELEEIS